MTSVASSQFSHCIQEAPQIKSTLKSLLQENTYRPWNLDEYEYNEYNFHAANIIFKNYFQPFNDKKKKNTFLAFRPYQHNLGVEFGPWGVRCNGLFYPFIVDSPTHRDHHSKTEWLSYVLWLWTYTQNTKPKLPKAAWGVRGSSPPPPRMLPGPPPPAHAWPPCYCQNLTFLCPPMPN